MVEALDGGGVSLETIAEKLSVTPRTLQRRLSDQGTSFKNVLDEVRKGLALSYITQPFIDLAELGYLLGFSDQTAFQRAFKKWTGTTPGKYKKNNQ
jgi:AraC-like DNA-binding protein